MASYAIDLQRLAEREFRSIPNPAVAYRIMVAMQEIAEDPRRGEQNPELGASFVYKVREYELAYFVDEELKIIHIASIFKGAKT